ncbi:BTAD domain-containing putative transcriptional regulator [Streptomyces sp. TS71-3]|uniref:AfsR/SARP family transcriptional regulator n=1 Tax=Streptomyces sp. TS71-3 TaxID=2733862 RepID=UPI001B0FDE8F|nr:BTAD domain-containing putative transcriptional regulator [Streptomyces sp. TS71-3]GHJ40537.1 hypothetical protein Sm713_61460 [Streptomyces sp. TS71-3]
MRYQILGATAAQTAQGDPIALGGPRLRALLTALALHPGRSVTTGTLMAEVWPDDPPSDASAALQALVGRLRRALGRDAVASDAGGYRLAADPDDVDLFRFERLVREGTEALGRDDAVTAARTLREALALWRGPALADLPDRSAATRPEAQRLEAARARVQADLRLGRASELIPELTELTTVHPYDEPLHALLIRALRAAGRGADALAAYERARRTLADGLGADPGPELRAMHAELLSPGGGPVDGVTPSAWAGRGPSRAPSDRGAPSAAPGSGTPSALSGQVTPRTAPDRTSLDGAPLDQAAPSGPPGNRATSSPTIGEGPTASDPPSAADGATPGPGPSVHPTRPAHPDDAALSPLSPQPLPPPHASQPPPSSHPPPLADPLPSPPPRHFAPPLPAPHDPASARRSQSSPPVPPRAPADRKGNLRPRLTSFVGREPELDAIRTDIRTARLVTLTGPGGSGKTRLAEEAAAGHPGAWLVELAPLDSPEAVPGAVVSALGLRETVLLTADRTVPQDDPVALLVEYCSARELLLVLDNCEHVVDTAARLAETLLTRCPGLTVLATSREPLGVPGECVRPVEPLPPDPAHRLFAERAAAVRPGFDPAQDPAAVDEICRRLDGLPLAIELAAARLRLLTPRQIADRLDDRFRLLTSGSRTALPRQQTLRAVVDWSWDLLTEEERTVLCEVSVFAGGWELPAAEAVCTGPAADLIGALVDKSLIVANPVESPSGGPSGGMRYRLLETIHEYAVERAAQRPTVRAGAERRHSAYIRALVEEAEPLLRSAEQLPWIHRLETELDNVRAVLHRALAAGDEELATSVALAIGWFWWLRNYRREGTDWILRILRLAFPTPEEPGAAPGEPGTPSTGTSSPGLPSPSAGTPSSTALPAVRTGRHSITEGLASEVPGATAADHARPLTGGSPDPTVLSFPTTAAGEQVDDTDHPLYWPRMNLCLIYMFLVADTGPVGALHDERSRAFVARLRRAFERPGPESARFPGIIWPFTVFFLDGPAAIIPALNASIDNCRTYGGDWEVGCLLMFRAHMGIDGPADMAAIDADLAELRELSGRIGDRWIRAQVRSASGEAAMARSRFGEAKQEYEEGLRLAYEVGAYAETPFLLARLGEIAYRAGDYGLMAKLVDEAADAADRYGVHDSRTFIRLLRGLIALDRGDVTQARAHYDAARAEAAHGSPPPQFTALLNAIEGRVVAAERGPAAGLPVLVAGLHEALVAQCADTLTASLIDTGALLVAELGDHRRAVRLLAAGLSRRHGCPRPMPEHAAAEKAEAEAVAALGRDRYEAERAAGARLESDAVLAELAAAVGAEPPRPLAESRPLWPPPPL